ncbi:MAG: zinc ribbon domain-containing protein [Thermodesulfobacteriota bacterium]|nr:zinc ribbon domain-containing protein [Thermodesulfobacteriota bacterium]
MVLTKADVYEKMIFSDRPVCPYCGQEMKIMACGQSGFVNGGRWGSPYLFICGNDACPLYAEGWDHMQETYGRPCSYRCICYPDSDRTAARAVYSSNQWGIIDEADIAVDKARGTDDDPAVQRLLELFGAADLKGLLSSLFDRDLYYKVRMRAAALIGELGLAEAIEPMLDFTFHDERIVAQVRQGINRIHDINETRECPFCAEVIEKEAEVCRHCGRPLP